MPETEIEKALLLLHNAGFVCLSPAEQTEMNEAYRENEDIFLGDVIGGHLDFLGDDEIDDQICRTCGNLQADCKCQK